MKPVIQRELDAIKKMVADLEKRLKNEREQLGHREVFDIGRRGEVPAPREEDRGRVLVAGVGWTTITGSGGGGGISTVEVDNLTISGNGSAASPLSASLLSGTIDARFKNLSGSLTGKFNSLSFLNAVSHDDTLSGDGTPGNPLSADPGLEALSGTFDSAIKAVATSSQVWSQTATGLEGTELVASLPHPYPNTEYYAFVTNFSGTYNPVFKTVDKTTHGFRVVSTAPFQSGDRVDFLAISGGLGPVADGTGLASLSGTINSAIVHLSGAVASRFTVGSLQLTSGSSPATLNFSDEGNIDWFVSTIATKNLLTQNWDSIHSKIGGGWIARTFKHFAGGNAPSIAAANVVGVNPTQTTNSSDTTATSALNANTTNAYWRIFNTTATGFGFTLSVPSSTETRVLRVYTSQNSSGSTISGHLTDGSAPDVSGSNVVAASTIGYVMWTFTFNSAEPAELVVTVTITTNNHNPSNYLDCGLIGATLSGNL